MSPATISPSRSAAIEIAKCGMPCRKLRVPSSGSTIQRWRGSAPGSAPLSSNNRPQPGRARVSSAFKVRSAFRSAVETKSPGPLTETCNCSTSPKARNNPRAAFSAAFAMTATTAERTIMPIYPVCSILGSLDIAAVGGRDDDARAGLDMRRDQDAAAVFEPAGLVGGRGGLAAHDRIGLDDRHHHAGRQFDRQRLALVEHDVADHALAQKIGGLADRF